MLSILAWGGIGGFNFADFLNQLESFGFFKYILPFLLIFALVYAILQEIPTFKDKRGPALIIALAIGLLALQLDVVPAFFQSIFPNLGIGLSILLVGLILSGVFIADYGKGDEKGKVYKWVFFGVGALIFLIVTFSSLSSFQFVGNYWWNAYGGLIIVALIIAGVIIAVVYGSKRQ